MLVNKFSAIAILAALTSVTASATASAEGDSQLQIRTIEAAGATGWNRRFEQPIHQFNDIGDFGFSSLRIRNPQGGRPSPITKDTPHSAIVSSYFDATIDMPNLPLMEGFSMNADAPAIADMPIIASRDGMSKVVAKAHLASDQMDVSIVGATRDITLGDWLAARGKLTIECEVGGENWLHIQMSGLIPVRHYTFWEWYVPTDLPGFAVAPTPAGGIGASTMSDTKGNASYSVQTQECYPLSADEETPSRAIVAVMQWDHRTHAGVPIAPLNPYQPRLPGDNASMQLWWPLTD